MPAVCHYLSPIPQKIVINKFSTFLTHLSQPEKLPKPAFVGLCSGLSLLLMRAILLNEEEHFFNRLSQLTKKTDEQIKNLSELYSDFRAKYYLAIEEQSYHLILKLRESSDFKKRQLIRDEHFAALEKAIIGSYPSEQRADILFAKDLYEFINSLLLGHFPLRYKINMNGKAVLQNDFLILLDLIASDIKPKTAIENVLHFTFNFNEKVLEDFLSKQLLEDDLVYISSTDHTGILIKKNGYFYFYDPNYSWGMRQVESALKLTKIFKKWFYEENVAGSSTLLFDFKIFAKSDTCKRPTPQALLQDIFIAYPDYNINAASDDGTTALGMASESNNLEMVTALLSIEHIELDKPKNSCLTPLLSAVIHGRADIVALLLEKGARVDLRALNNKTAIQLATEGDYSEIVELLAKNNASVNESFANNTLLTFAAREGYLNTVKVLLKAKADVNLFVEFPALWTAASKGHLEIAQLLIEQQADVNAQAKFSNSTALFIAAQNNRTEIVELLLTHQADPNISSAAGYTPLFMAAQADNLNIVEKLLAANAIADKTPPHEVSPLYLAAKNGNVRMIKLLLDYHADVNKNCGEERYPIQIAVMNGHREAVKLLIAEHADLSKKDKDGLSLIDLAINHKRWDIAILLLIIEIKENGLTAALKDDIKFQQKNLVTAFNLYLHSLSVDTKSNHLSLKQEHHALSLLEILLSPCSFNLFQGVKPKNASDLLRRESPLSSMCYLALA